MLIFSAILWGVSVVYQERQERHRHQAEQELYAINYLQTQGVVDWREQRLTDATALLDDTLLAQTIASWLQNRLDPQQVLVQERLRILQERQKYTAVYLVNAQGHLQLGPADTAAGVLPAPEQQALQQAFSQALVSVVEPRHDPFFAFPFFSLIAPIFDGAQPVGAIWLVSDVRTTLYPRLQAWPTPRTTAESILFSRSGNQAQALNPLRHPLDSTTAFKIPVDGAESLQRADFVAQAMLGVRGIFYGSDYREQDVLAMTSAVPESPWMVVSKIDVAEAFVDTQMREVLALSLPVSLCLLLAGLVFAYVQRRAWLRERALKIELQRHMGWLEGAQKAASIGYFAFDMTDKNFAMSSMAREIFGLPDGVDMGLKEWATLVLPDERQKGIRGTPPCHVVGYGPACPIPHPAHERPSHALGRGLGRIRGSSRKERTGADDWHHPRHHRTQAIRRRTCQLPHCP